MKICLTCLSKPAEAERYDYCKECWWAQDPRNPANLLVDNTGKLMVSSGTKEYEPIFFSNENTSYFDIDDTMVMWTKGTHYGEGKQEFENPYNGETYWLIPHAKHIDFLKSCHGRGHLIVVWSAGGSAWAKEVVSKLGLSQYVHLIITKPVRYIDDLKGAGLDSHIYLPAPAISQDDVCGTCDGTGIHKPSHEPTPSTTYTEETFEDQYGLERDSNGNVIPSCDPTVPGHICGFCDGSKK